MDNVERDRIWQEAQRIWKLDGEHRVSWWMADLLGFQGKNRYLQVRNAGLHRPHDREAFFARLAQMDLIELHAIYCDCERCKRARNQEKGE